MRNDPKNPFAWPEGPLTIRILDTHDVYERREVPVDYKPPPPKCVLCELGVPRRAPEGNASPGS